MKCKICANNENNKKYTVKEMMFGSLDEFEYFQCSKCGCLQILQLPENISKYYENNYYSYAGINVSAIKKFIRHYRDLYALTHKGLFGKFLLKLYPNNILEYLRELNVSKESKILDVGCGCAALLHQMKDFGYTNLLGVDPFINEDIEYENGLQVKKDFIQNIGGKWDFIMCNHSFEHFSSPLEDLSAISKVLADNGVCLISIPTVSSYVWEHYKTNWVQLDAPRHFFLHSIESFKILADKCNLVVDKVIYNSSEFQFLGSEQYKKGISLCASDNSFYVNPKKSIFSKNEIKQFKQKAKELNKENIGDQITIILKHPTSLPLNEIYDK